MLCLWFMGWNWQQPEWPDFTCEPELLEGSERDFLRGTDLLFEVYGRLDEHERDRIKAEIIGEEALKTSEIEGEYLNRENLRSSLLRHFGLETAGRKASPAETGITDLMVDLCDTSEDPLSHEMLYRWHRMLTRGRTDLRCAGVPTSGAWAVTASTGSRWSRDIFTSPKFISRRLPRSG